MLAPVLYAVDAFSATDEQEFEFSWSGPQSYGSKLTIVDAESGTVVHSEVEMNQRSYFTLLPNTLENGYQYFAHIEVLDSNGDVISDQSDNIWFWCFSEPFIGFYGIGHGSVIPTYSYTFEIEYDQFENEPLSQYYVILYDNNRKKLQTFSTKYVSAYGIIPPQPVAGFEDGTSYQIRIIGTTEHGVRADSGYVEVSASYEQKTMYSLVEAENNVKHGSISITSNLISITGVPEDSNVVYINGDYADLRQNKISYSKGVSFTENWKIGAKICGITVNQPIIEWTDGTYSAVVYYREATFDINDNVPAGYFELLVDGPLTNSDPTDLKSDLEPAWHTIINSNFIQHIDVVNTELTLWITKESPYYGLEVEVGDYLGFI